MGQIKYFIYSISKIFPYKYRKPFFIMTGILGMLIFMDFMIKISGSVYLIALKKEINAVMSLLIENDTLPLFIIFICALTAYIGNKYYSNLKMAISIGYLVILILSILPMLIG